MQRPLMLLVLACAACGGSTEPAAPATGPTSRPTVQPGPAIPIVAGEVELTGELAQHTEGALHVVGTAAGLETPLVARANLADGERTAAGTRLVPFVLHSRSGMLAASDVRPDRLPETLSLKVSFSPDGYVETIERWHDLRVDVAVGAEDLRIRMEPGQRPTSRPTGSGGRPASRPVVPAGD